MALSPATSNLLYWSKACGTAANVEGKFLNLSGVACTAGLIDPRTASRSSQTVRVVPDDEGRLLEPRSQGREKV